MPDSHPQCHPTVSVMVLLPFTNLHSTACNACCAVIGSSTFLLRHLHAVFCVQGFVGTRPGLFTCHTKPFTVQAPQVPCFTACPIKQLWRMVAQGLGNSPQQLIIATIKEISQTLRLLKMKDYDFWNNSLISISKATDNLTIVRNSILLTPFSIRLISALLMPVSISKSNWDNPFFFLSCLSLFPNACISCLYCFSIRVGKGHRK